MSFTGRLSLQRAAVSFLNLYDSTDDIIEFDLDKQSLAVIKGPSCLKASPIHQTIQADNGDVGLARLEMWQRKVNCGWRHMVAP